MTQETRNELINFVIYSFLQLLLLGFQSSLWPSFLGARSAPHFVLYAVIFFALFHERKWGLLFLVVCVLLYTSASIVPLEILLFIFAGVYFLVGQLKKRIFWPGLSYFILVTAFAVSLFHLLYYLLSWLLEHEAAGTASVQWAFWFLQLLSSVVFAPLFYFVYLRLEATTRGFDTSDVEEAL